VPVGTWFVIRNSYNLVNLYLNFEETTSFSDFTNFYKVVEWKSNKIVLKHHYGGDNYDYLTFEKIEE
jgi:hypothetical protein